MSSLISNYTYPIFQWVFCSTAIAVTGGRFYIRWRYFKTFRWDDYFNGLAVCCLIAYTACVEAADYGNNLVHLYRTGLAEDMLMWTVLYLVKGSFLALIWSIFNVSADFRKAWWVVTVYTFLGFWPIVLSELWQCGDPSQYDNPSACQKSHERLSAQLSIIWFRFVLHVTSDLFILTLPLAHIQKLHMSRGKKISVAAVFALIIIDIISGILRNVVSVYSGMQQSSKTSFDVALITGVIEPAVAVIVCALPVYRALLPSSKKRRNMPDELRRNAATVGLSSPHARRPTQASDEANSLSMAEPEAAHMI